jgi:hypothetical protein
MKGSARKEKRACFAVCHNIQIMPITRRSQKSQQALSSPAAFNIDNFIDDMEEKEMQLGIQPAGAGVLDISTGYNEVSSRAFSISSDKVSNFTRRTFVSAFSTHC